MNSKPQLLSDNSSAIIREMKQDSLKFQMDVLDKLGPLEKESEVHKFFRVLIDLVFYMGSGLIILCLFLYVCFHDVYSIVDCLLGLFL